MFGLQLLFLNGGEKLHDPVSLLEILADHIDLGVALLAGGRLEGLHLSEGNVEQVQQADSFALEHGEELDDKVAARGEDGEGGHRLRLQQGGHDGLLPPRVALNNVKSGQIVSLRGTMH